MIKIVEFLKTLLKALNVYAKKISEDEIKKIPIETNTEEVSKALIKQPEVRVDYYDSIKFEAPDFIEMWNKCELDKEPDKIKSIEQTVNKIILNKHIYLQVQVATNVPWYFVGALHFMEASLNMRSCLHNGQPWNQKTTIVPIGRGPWNSWSEAAIDAMKYDKLNLVSNWNYPKIMQLAEKYNGTGYRKRGITSPYVWSFTNMSHELGKYVSDGKFDPLAKHSRPGVASIIKFMVIKNLI